MSGPMAWCHVSKPLTPRPLPRERVLKCCKICPITGSSGSSSKVFPRVADVKQRTMDGSSLYRGARNADSHTAYGYGDQ